MSDKRGMVDLFGNAQAAFKFALGRESNFRSLIRGSYVYPRDLPFCFFFDKRQMPDPNTWVRSFGM
jgi:hypothetical protein